jgi:hypothetical protein
MSKVAMMRVGVFIVRSCRGEGEDEEKGGSEEKKKEGRERERGGEESEKEVKTEM